MTIVVFRIRDTSLGFIWHLNLLTEGNKFWIGEYRNTIYMGIKKVWAKGIGGTESGVPAYFYKICYHLAEVVLNDQRWKFMSAGNMGEQNKGMGMAERKSFVVLTGLLFSFWVIISGILEVKYLAIGLISSLITAWICRPLLYLGAPGDREYLAYDFSIPRYLAFWPWLLWEIVKANIHIAMIVRIQDFHQPHVFTFRKKMNVPLPILLWPIPLH